MGKCIRCGVENAYQDYDYRCYQCFGENSPHVRWTDPPDNDPAPADEAPETWPPHWRLTKSSWGHDIVECTKHKSTFGKTDKCLQCKAANAPPKPPPANAAAAQGIANMGAAAQRLAKALGALGPLIPSGGNQGGSGQSTPMQSPPPAVKWCNKHGVAYSTTLCQLCLNEAWGLLP